MATGQHMSHGHMNHMAASAMLPNRPAAWTAGAFWWLVMIVAMMFPMVRDPIRHTAARSLWRRRHRAISGFLMGYLGPWMIFGIVVSVIVSGLEMETWLRPAVGAALGFGAAVLWQVTQAKRRAILACHRTMPITPAGWRADLDCLRYGWRVGSSCLVSCWALMLACLLAGHSLPAMIFATTVGWTERNVTRPNHPWLCAAIAAFAISYAVASVYVMSA